MKNGGFRKVVLGLVFLTASSGLWAAEHYKVLNGPKDFYFGHISYIESTPEGMDPVVLREGQSAPEQAVLNLPVGPGDTVRTSADRRCEIQFDTGTVVRLDFGTVVRVETILARSLSSLEQISNLALDKGRIYVMYREYDGREIFQVLTPNAAVKMKHNAVALITAAGDGATETKVKYGKAQMRFGASERLLDDQAVRKGERLIVQKDNQFQLAPAIEGTAFDLWNKEVNAHFDDLHEGLTALPKPIQKLPGAVFYFAQNYGSLYGEWLWDEFYGYVWRPFVDNGMYPWGWRPYYAGRWSSSGGQMFWVPQEPWGWIPYHLGIWQWDKKLGWVWLPGSLFAPAWVDWEFYFGHFGWRPWGLYDWFGDFYLDAFYMGDAWYYGWPRPSARYYAWSRGYLPGDPVPGPFKPELDQTSPRSATGSAQRPPAAFPIPSELKGAYKNMLAAYKKGDPRVFESMSKAPSQVSFVAKGDLTRSAVQGKTVSWAGVPKLAGIPGAKNPSMSTWTQPDARLAAMRAFRANEAAQQLLHGAGIPGRVQRVTERPAAGPVPSPGRGPGLQPSQAMTRVRAGDAMGPGSHPRFLDWNPDVKVARSLGVNIEYSSRGNEVRCPELHLTSSDRIRGADSGVVPTLGRQGISYEPAGSSGVSGSGDSGGGAARTGPSAGGAASPGARGSGGEGSSGGGKIKN